MKFVAAGIIIICIIILLVFILYRPCQKKPFAVKVTAPTRKCGSATGLRMHDSIYGHLPDVPIFGGGDPSKGKPYDKKPCGPCSENRLLWLETDEGRLYPWDIFPTNSYKADRDNLDCELINLLGESSFTGEPRRDKPMLKSIPDHLKMTQ